MNRLTFCIRHDRTATLCCGVVLLLATVRPQVGVAAVPYLRPDDQLWIVSTRHLGSPDDRVPELRVRQLHPESGWQSTDLSSLVEQSVDDRVSVIYVHGNRLERDEVTRNMWDMYRCLTMDQAEVPPLRFVTWSWPSDKRSGILRDVRAKAVRTEADGYYLGWFLTQLPADRPLRLVGYSFGARIVNGASHLLGGGTLSGRCLVPAVACDAAQPLADRPRVVLMAAATHSSWLRPGRYHERALERVGYLLNIYNGRDRILKRYQAIDKCSKPKALGYKGMFTADLGTDGERIEQIDAASVVGREHSIANYQRHPWLRSRIQKALFAANPAAN